MTKKKKKNLNVNNTLFIKQANGIMEEEIILISVNIIHEKT